MAHLVGYREPLPKAVNSVPDSDYASVSVPHDASLTARHRGNLDLKAERECDRANIDMTGLFDTNPTIQTVDVHGSG